MQTISNFDFTYTEQETTSGTEYFVIDNIEATFDVAFFVIPAGILIFLIILKTFWGR